jgi:hypothetical protein
MYQLDLEKLTSNVKIIKTFSNFFKNMPKPGESGFDKLSTYADKENGQIICHTSLPSADKVDGSKPELFNYIYNRGSFYKFEFNKSVNSKFETSRVYGLQEKLESCPDILMDKVSFRKKYKSTLIPEYNYDLKIDSTKKKEIAKCFEYEFMQINGLVKHVKQEVEKVFEKYGEVEVIEINNFTIFHIKNVINFYVVIELEKSYKLSAGDSVYGIVPNYKLAIKLFEGDPQIEDHRDPKGNVKRCLIFKPKVKSYYFRVEFRYLDFLKKPAYFVFCMTPHGYIRLKKEYSLDFFNKIVYHYLFKKYFEKYNIELSNEDLEKNPQSFFNLISMLKY